jgi:hypothetical protein
MNFWDAEQLQFKIEQGPDWLTIDSKTGELSGKPDRPGREAVIVSATLLRERRPLDPGQLQWGVEKALETRIEIVGDTKQAFFIETK